MSVNDPFGTVEPTAANGRCAAVRLFSRAGLTGPHPAKSGSGAPSAEQSLLVLRCSVAEQRNAIGNWAACSGEWAEASGSRNTAHSLGPWA